MIFYLHVTGKREGGVWRRSWADPAVTVSLFWQVQVEDGTSVNESSMTS